MLYIEPEVVTDTLGKLRRELSGVESLLVEGKNAEALAAVNKVLFGLEIAEDIFDYAVNPVNTEAGDND